MAVRLVDINWPLSFWILAGINLVEICLEQLPIACVKTNKQTNIVV